MGGAEGRTGNPCFDTLTFQRELVLLIKGGDEAFHKQVFQFESFFHAGSLEDTI
jgi:hypothetical protein